MPAEPTHRVTRVRSSSANPNRRAHGRRAEQVEHLGGGHPAPGQREQPDGERQQRVDRRQRPVGEPDPEPVGRVTFVADDVGQAEPRRDQRGEGLDVGTHHQDVARLEGRVVVEQPDQHLAQHVDLAARPVAGVHLDRAVARGKDARRELGGSGQPVGGEV